MFITLLSQIKFFIRRKILNEKESFGACFVPCDGVVGIADECICGRKRKHPLYRPFLERRKGGGNRKGMYGLHRCRCETTLLNGCPKLMQTASRFEVNFHIRGTDFQ